jgi:hypothetical protein
MLPYASCSTWALIALLGRWGFGSSRHGGLSNDKHRRACQEFLHKLIAIATLDGSKELVIPIEVEDVWEIRWPRPQGCGVVVALVVSRDGTVDFRDFMMRLCAAVGGLGRGWWTSKELQRLLEQSSRSGDFQSLLVNSATTKALVPFHLQLLWHCGLRVQEVILDAWASQANGLITVRETSMEECMESANIMDRRLVAYQECCRAAARNHSCFTCCTDKSSVCGLGSGLQTTIFVIGDTNLALFAAPQVPTQTWPHTLPPQHKALPH